MTQQQMVAFEKEEVVRVTLISTGKSKTPTPTGLYHIRIKLRYDDMRGSDYYLRNVPYVMYFQLVYALHSAFWHNAFGRSRSHGCINMAPIDAKWLFDWITPELPEKWHSVYPTEKHPGTRLYIRGETPVR